ncbi:MAG: nucleotidyltransferase family protein [Lachnospiraceae bacterium]|nr:nucleotidyltransferase family protein [Lachnospiraceae bacterium]
MTDKTSPSKKDPGQKAGKPGCVIMAAGNSRRFGSNKLTALINGKPLLSYAFDALPVEKLSHIVTVTRYEEAEALAASYGFCCIRNDHPEKGLSHTVRLGTQALCAQCDAILYMVSDQPLLRRESVAGLIDLYQKHPDHIVSAASGKKRGNPCIFPRKYFSLLLNLRGDTGGSAVIRDHREELLLFDIREEELLDADTPEAFAQIRSFLLS